jgi:hypothetical protein
MDRNVKYLFDAQKVCHCHTCLTNKKYGHGRTVYEGNGGGSLGIFIGDSVYSGKLNYSLGIFIGDSGYSGKLNYSLGIFIGDSVYSGKLNYSLGILFIQES